MRYYVVRCGYWCEFRFRDANEAGRLLARMAAHVHMDEDEIKNKRVDHTSFELVVYDVLDDEPETDLSIEDPDLDQACEEVE